MDKHKLFYVDLWNNGNPLTIPEMQPASIRVIDGTGDLVLTNQSGFAARVSFKPSLSPTPMGAPAPMPVDPPDVDLVLQPGQVVEVETKNDQIQIWLEPGPVPAAYAPVEIRAN